VGRQSGRMAVGPRPVADQGLCLSTAHYSTLLKWHLRVPFITTGLRGQTVPHMRRACGRLRRPRRVV